jgi:serine/threonine protein kinase
VYGFFEDNECFFTLMELGCDGHLYTLISEKNGLTEETTSFIVKNLLQAVDYMHQHKILHSDIKLENIVRIMVTIHQCRAM